MFAVQFVQHNAQSQMFVFEGFLKMHLFQYITLYRHEVGHGAKVSLLPLAIHDTSAATVCGGLQVQSLQHLRGNIHCLCNYRTSYM